MTAERHPFPPFLPPAARLLMLGSFPPQPKRWCMDFYYPNRNNDMWRIMGLVFFGDKDYFVQADGAFDKQKIVDFATRKGIAMYDTATVVRRLQDNASDKFLEVVEATDIPALLRQIPQCRALAVTGQKAADVVCETFGIAPPPVGGSATFPIDRETYRLYRMPSSSRAYPLALPKKAAFYHQMFSELQLA